MSKVSRRVKIHLGEGRETKSSKTKNNCERQTDYSSRGHQRDLRGRDQRKNVPE